MKGKIIFVHGFGARSDPKGLFGSIIEKLPNYTSILTDLNYLDQDTGNVHLNLLHTQAGIIKKVYEKESVGSEIYLICHSQGCVVASLADLPHISKVIFLTPPVKTALPQTLNRLTNQEEVRVNLEGDTYMKRSDGSYLIIPKEYWEERKGINHLELYRKMASHNDLTVINAKQDEIISNDSTEVLAPFTKVIEIDGDHSFMGNREEIANIISGILGNN